MKREAGFSLVEVLVALALLAGGMMAMATMSVTSLQSVDRSGEETTAMILSQQRMEWIRNQDYESAAMAAGTTTEALTGDYAGYSRVTVIVNGDPIADVKSVRVSTTSPAGRLVPLSSFMAE
jgi:prepilin-type N-terminal cleavage/methylation domain-containing protein